MAEEQMPSEGGASEGSRQNKKKIIIGVSIVVALIVIFIVILLLLLGSCTHHHTMVYHPAVSPTCESAGSVQYWHCEECGNDYIDEEGSERIEDVTIDMLPHIEVTEAGKAATCTEDGYTERKYCRSCGEEIAAREVIPALGHEIPEGGFSVVKEAGCTEEGLETCVCARCGDTIERTIPAKGHTEEIVPGTPATCTTEGKSDGIRCSVCGEVLKEGETIPKTAHRYGETVVKVSAGCNSTGVGESVCEFCGDVKREMIPALGHDPVSEDVPATCETSGRKGRVVCGRCGEVLEEGEIVPPLGHEIVGNECINCPATASEGLEFKWSNNSEEYYMLAGIGTCTDTHILVPDVYDDGVHGKHPVKSILNSAFEGCTSIITISIPHSINGIGVSAFADCTALVSVTLGENVRTLGALVFENCSSLIGVRFKGSTEYWNVRNDPADSEGIRVTDPLDDPAAAAELFTGKYVTYSWFIGGSRRSGYLFLD